MQLQGCGRVHRVAKVNQFSLGLPMCEELIKIYEVYMLGGIV